MSSKKSDLVDRNELLAEVEKVYKDHYEQAYSKAIHDLYNAVRKRIRRAPAVEAREIVHAKWEKHKCANCGKTEPGYYDPTEDCIVYTPSAYCPSCGAMMWR